MTASARCMVHSSSNSTGAVEAAAAAHQQQQVPAEVPACCCLCRAVETHMHEVPRHATVHIVIAQMCSIAICMFHRNVQTA
jgi:hypothetical protein